MKGGPMSDVVSQLETQLLTLPQADRARLAELLISSLDEAVVGERSSEPNAAGLEEVKRRRAAILAGHDTTVTAEEVVDRLRGRSRR